MTKLDMERGTVRINPALANKLCTHRALTQHAKKQNNLTNGTYYKINIREYEPDLV